jgi:hypothetical protein
MSHARSFTCQAQLSTRGVRKFPTIELKGVGDTDSGGDPRVIMFSAALG